MQRREFYEPPEIVTNGGVSDLRSATQEELYIQRIVRLAFLMPGDLHHRPTLGGGLQEFQNKPATPEILRRIRLRFIALLQTLPEVKGYGFDVVVRDGRACIINVQVQTDIGDLTIPEISFDNT